MASDGDIKGYSLACAAVWVTETGSTRTCARVDVSCMAAAVGGHVRLGGRVVAFGGIVVACGGRVVAYGNRVVACGSRVVACTGICRCLPGR